MATAAGKMAREFRLHARAPRIEIKGGSNARDSLKYFFFRLTPRSTNQSTYPNSFLNSASIDTIYEVMRHSGAKKSGIKRSYFDLSRGTTPRCCQPRPPTGLSCTRPICTGQVTRMALRLSAHPTHRAAPEDRTQALFSLAESNFSS